MGGVGALRLLRDAEGQGAGRGAWWNGLTPTITFIVASDFAIATKRAAVQNWYWLNKARLWSLDHLPEYAKNTSELTKLPEDVLLSAYTTQKTSPI